MRRISLGLIVPALIIAACGGGDVSVAVAPEEALIEISSEGGFVPVEFALGQGATYTVLGDGTLIYPGVTTLEFPGRLIQPQLTARLSDSELNAVLALVEEMGLAEIVDETDDSAAQFVADASTEVIRYWDASGEHRYAVYALGIEESPSERNAAFLELISTLAEFSAQTPGEAYDPERVRIVTGPGTENPDFVDIRPWPLDEEWDQWQDLANGWRCRVYGAEVLTTFEDATQVTTWEVPEGGFDLDPATLLVRPLHPGEPDCPT